MIPQKEIILEKLQTTDIRFHFTYADKTKSSTLCTLNLSKIPKEAINQIGPPIKEIIVAWDLENYKWVAFKPEKIAAMEY